MTGVLAAVGYTGKLLRRGTARVETSRGLHIAIVAPVCMREDSGIFAIETSGLHGSKKRHFAQDDIDHSCGAKVFPRHIYGEIRHRC